MLFEWRSRKQNRDETARVGDKLGKFARSVAVTQQQQIDFRRRVAQLLNRNQVRRSARLRSIDEHVFWIDRSLPDLRPIVFCVALLKHDMDRAVRRGKAKRFTKAAHDLVRFVRRFPFAINRSKATRVEHAAALLTAHLEKILTEVRLIDR